MRSAVWTSSAEWLSCYPALGAYHRRVHCGQPAPEPQFKMQKAQRKTEKLSPGLIGLSAIASIQ